MRRPKYDAVLFISFGGPERREDIMPFLERVTQGRGIPHERLLEVAHHYEVMGGASPINEITRRQADALRNFLRQQGEARPVYIGQRNWHPLLEQTLGQMAEAGVKRAVGFITAAHRCEASHERYIQATEEARRRIGTSAPLIDYVGPWFDHPLFIEAIGERIKATLRPGEGGPSWIFTAHSIPTPMAEASRYVQELETTARLVSEKFGQTQWSLAYSSRSGRPEDPWLEPDVRDAIRTEAQNGASSVLLIPIGFVADHVEVLFDLDVEAKATAQALGIGFYRASTVGDHPSFIRMMADLLKAAAFSPARS